MEHSALIVEEIAKRYNLPVVLFCDTAHLLQSEYSEVVFVDVGKNSADIRIANLCKKDDIVVTQDYGLAAMVLARGACGIHQSGMWYTDENIDSLLMRRRIPEGLLGLEKCGSLKHPKKRKHRDDEVFKNSFEKLVSKKIMVQVS